MNFIPQHHPILPCSHKKWKTVCQISWIKSTRERLALIFFFPLSFWVIQFYKMALPKGQDHEEIGHLRYYFGIFPTIFFSYLITAGCKFSVIKEYLYVQKVYFISLFISTTTKYLPAVTGQEFLKDRNYVWSPKMKFRKNCCCCCCFLIFPSFLDLKRLSMWGDKSISGKSITVACLLSR